MWLAPGERHERLDRLGPDALEITGEALFAATRKRRTPIKAVLLDQRVAAGTGNIYADEALFLAGVRVEFCHEARVFGDVPGRVAAFHAQRSRWDVGKYKLRNRYGKGTFLPASLLDRQDLKRRAAEGEAQAEPELDDE